jgi:signal transduction histidine kinase/DNA-binding response OmpR family regulator
MPFFVKHIARIFFLLHITAFVLLGQEQGISNKRPDIAYLERTHENKAALVTAYIDLAQWFEFAPQFNVDSTAFYLEQAIKIAESLKPTSHEALANAYFNAAKFYKELPIAIDLAEKAMKHCHLIENKQTSIHLQYDILIFMSKFSARLGKKTKSIELYQKAYDLYKNEPNTLIQFKLAINTYDFYQYFGGNDNLKELRFQQLQKAEKLFTSVRDKIAPDSFRYFYSAYLLYYSDYGQIDSCFYYIEKLKETMQYIINKPIRLSWFEMIYGEIEMKANNNENAKRHINAAINVLEKYHLTNEDNYQYSLFLLGQIAYQQIEYDKAIAYFKKSNGIAAAKKNPGSVIETLIELSKSYEKKGDLAQSIAYYKQYSEETIKLKTEEYTKGIQDLQIRLDTEGKEKELANQKVKLSIYIGVIIVSVLLLGLLFFFYNRQRRGKAILQNQNTIINKQAEELRLLDMAKTRFFANVSHELRTPLTLMLAPLSTMIKSNTLDNKNFTLASLVRQNAQGLLKLVNEILDLNKLEAKKLELNEEKTVVYNLIRRIIAGFESSAEINHIDFNFDYQSDKYLQLWLDNNKFEKILNNLLSNAFKFTKPKGQVNITVTDSPMGLKISVADTGRGIHSDDLPHIFDRFYQSNQADALTEGGTGIGLSLSMELVKLMGGQLTVESTLGKGSTFTFDLPKKEVMGTIPTAEAAEMQQKVAVVTEGVDLASIQTVEPSDGVKPTILIVEDNRSLRDYLSLILNTKYTILKAENGQAALEMMNDELRMMNNETQSQTDSSLIIHHSSLKKLPDLILSDVMMPIMDGFQLLSHLKSSDKYCSIPVVMLTARAELQDKLKALRIGVDDYLLKPFEEEELFARIENLLKNAQLRQFLNETDLETNSILETQNSKPQNTEGGAEESPSISATDMAWLEELEKSVKQNLKSKDYSVERMASDMAMSRVHLFRKLKQLTGLAPQQYLQEVRLQQALYLLETQQENSVKAVCYAVGLLQVNHFSQLFHQRFGKLPSSYLV